MVKQLAEQIFTELGPGYSERVYHNAFEVLLRKHGIQYETERIVPIEFHGHVIGNVRADLIVDGAIIVELKSAKSLTQAMKTQIFNYLQLTEHTRGILINFPLPPATRCEFEECVIV